MDLVLNRRSTVKASLGLLTALSLGHRTGVFAQDASPEATPAFTPSVSITAGPGEGEFTVTHSQGETVVKANPETVVSFDAASIDTLQTLGVTLAGVPELNAGDHLALDGIETVGTMQEPDFEKVNGIAPDLIIIAGRTAEMYDDLNAIAPTINLAFGQGDVIPNLGAAVNVLATLFGKEADAESLLAEVDTRVAALKEQAAGVGSALVIMTSGGSVTALAPDNERGGRGSLIYKTLGLKPPVEDLEGATHGEPISFEFLLEHNPDWLFVIDRDQAVGAEDGQPAAQVLDNEIMHQTAAWTNERIVYLDPFDWYVITGAGLTSINRQLDELEAAFA